MNNVFVQDFILLVLIFVRVLSAFTTAPVFGHNSFPVLPRVFLAFLTAYIIKLYLSQKNIQVDVTTYGIVIGALKEVVTGLIIGFFLQLVFHAVSFAGSLIGFQLGFSMAEIFNPADDAQINLISQFFSLATILLFFLVNGHHYVIRSLAISFDIVKPASFIFTKPLYQLLISGSGAIFVIALKIASPIIISFILIQIAEGIISKIIPQMQVFFVTQPIKAGAGLLLLAALMPVYIYVIKDMLRLYEDSLVDVIKAMAGV